MLHSDICLIVHRPVAYNLCLLNFLFVSSGQKPIRNDTMVVVYPIAYFHWEA